MLKEVTERGPLRPGDLENHSNGSRGPWWDWSDAKLALEALFFTGRLTVAERVNFIRHYDLPERVLPAEIVAAEVDEVTARRQLLKQAVRHHGIGTVADLADYYRMRFESSAVYLAEMAEEGDGRGGRGGRMEGAGLHGSRCPDAAVDQRTGGAVPLRSGHLVSTADRAVVRLPLPDRDLHATRRRGSSAITCSRSFSTASWSAGSTSRPIVRLALLRVRGSYVEEGQDPTRVAAPLATEMRTMAAWLGLDDVAVEKKGNLAAALEETSLRFEV